MVKSESHKNNRLLQNLFSLKNYWLLKVPEVVQALFLLHRILPSSIAPWGQEILENVFHWIENKSIQVNILKKLWN